ncbi:MAG TPA: hypothetical protein VIG48_08305 [Jatrophihabitans sp.]
MPTFRLLAAAAALAVAGATLTPVAPAVAGTHCTARGAMPRRVALHQDKTVVTITLRGSAGCHNQRTDNGATATLVRPSGAGDSMRWRHFGSTQSVIMYVNLVRPGTFDLKNGDVQVYDHSYRQVPWSWVRTTMVVKRAAHISHPAASGGVVSGRAKQFTKYGWQGYAGKRVFVQRRAVGTSGWTTLGSVFAGKYGGVGYATRTSARYEFRLVLRASDTVWNARSTIVRG